MFRQGTHNKIFLQHVAGVISPMINHGVKYMACNDMFLWWSQVHNGVLNSPPYNDNDAIMTTMASQITSLMDVYSTVYSDADQRKHQCSASLAFVWGIHWDRWIPRTKGQLRGNCFHLMTSSCYVTKVPAQTTPTHALGLSSDLG